MFLGGYDNIIHLNSIMFLLIPNIGRTADDASGKAMFPVRFKFHYVSINSINCCDCDFIWYNLNSIMFLLIRFSVFSGNLFYRI